MAKHRTHRNLEDIVLLKITEQIKDELAMSDLDRGIMKFKNADKPIVIAISSVLVFGSITFLLVWAVSTAYAIP